MIPAAERDAPHPQDTYGLPENCSHLIAKLRLGLIPPELAHLTQKEAA